MTVYGYASSGYIVESRYQIDESGLSAAAHADKGNRLAGFNLKIYIL